MHLPPQPPWKPTPNLPKEGTRAQVDWENMFRKLLTEQNSTNERRNATKLDKTQRNSTTTPNEHNEAPLILH